MTLRNYKKIDRNTKTKHTENIYEGNCDGAEDERGRNEVNTPY